MFKCGFFRCTDIPATTLRMSVVTRRINWSAITNTYSHVHTTEGSESGKSEEMRAIRKADRRKEEGNPI